MRQMGWGVEKNIRRKEEVRKRESYVFGKFEVIPCGWNTDARKE